MFYDYAKIFVKAGNGGNGVVAFRREKYVPDGGPAGGDGGLGGNVIFEADEGMRTLLDFRFKKHFKAPSGEHGRNKNMHGAKGDDMIVKVPVGTLIKTEDGEVIGDMTVHGQRITVAKGGRGGKGNARFVSSINRSPNVADNGEPGQERALVLELKLLADVGLVGFPNVGKSSIISRVSAAKPKIADYHFTTIDPNLGMVKVGDDSFVMVDIPGLVEGASEGAGLGHRFLRHVERTRLLVHVIDISGIEGRNPIEDFNLIQEEIHTYNPKLAQMPMLVAANKMDLPQAEEHLKEFQKAFGQKFEIFPVCAATGEGLTDLTYRLSQLLKEMPAKEPVEMEQIKVTRLAQDNEPDMIVRKENDYWTAEGKEVRRQIERTDFSNDAAVDRLIKILRTMGIEKALRQAGAQSGDSVVIGSMEFEYLE